MNSMEKRIEVQMKEKMEVAREMKELLQHLAGGKCRCHVLDEICQACKIKKAFKRAEKAGL